MAVLTGLTRVPDPVHSQQLSDHVSTTVGKTVWVEVTPTEAVASGVGVVEGDRTAIQNAISSYSFQDTQTPEHDHDGDYSATGHNHDAAYSATAHNHDAAYSATGHTHNYAATSHTHASADVNSGTLDIARVPTGTTSTTVSLGNHTHAGGNDARLITARKTANQAITGAAAAVTDMFLTLAANSTYYVYFSIPVTTSSGTSPTLTLSFTGPATPTLVNLRRVQMTSATAVAFSTITSFTAFAAGASVANITHTVEGIVVTAAGSGNMQLRAAAAGTVPSITIPAGASAYAIKTA